MATMDPIPPIPGDDSVVPLFQSRTSILRTIRMETVQDIQTVSLVNQAITDVRLEFFSSLGVDRANVIAGYPDEDNPTTENGITKAYARTAEAYWVIYKLVPLLPTLFMDNTQGVNESFNEEPLTRDSAKVVDYMDHLWKTLQRYLNLIKDPAETGDGVTSAALIERQDSDGDADPYIVFENFIGLYPGDL